MGIFSGAIREREGKNERGRDRKRLHTGVKEPDR